MGREASRIVVAGSFGTASLDDAVGCPPPAHCCTPVIVQSVYTFNACGHSHLHARTVAALVKRPGAGQMLGSRPAALCTVVCHRLWGYGCVCRHVAEVRKLFLDYRLQPCCPAPRQERGQLLRPVPVRLARPLHWQECRSEGIHENPPMCPRALGHSPGQLA